ncbi:hypothetical protein COCC4DRAFT_63324 [Bipolaris maydis ATCC 48331]|uniref:Transcription factor domain-containing protein n=1 Tax=Cochliobolus heterostrophus (strain C4 / ATCC 48331 / race T) TaxID=665024 RepID=N4X756_COCH4|nr:uncharacterized protein COCC4DRAFT_63324 [Bipolaris maydis ATCC 48331]ENI02396.1 hypothetical protein COCC4DRAFT_63324 [Bipolaris maydis ATCC 48331]
MKSRDCMSNKSYKVKKGSRTDISIPVITIVEPVQNSTSSLIDQNVILPQKHIENHTDHESILLPEIINLHHDLGCLMIDADGEYQATYAGEFGQLSDSWLYSLHSIVALCVICDPSHNGMRSSQQAHESLEIAKKLVPQVCDKAALDSLRALIVLSLAFQSNAFTNSAYLHVGLAVLIAFSLDHDVSLALGKPCTMSSSINLGWAPPLPSETLTQRIRHVLYDSTVHGGQELSDVNFNDNMAALREWLAQVPLHLQPSTLVPLPHRRPIFLLHLCYWSAIMLITKPFLLRNLLEDGYQFRVKQCLKILLAISVSGYPKQLLPEPLYQLQQGGLAEDVGDGNSMLPQHLQAHQEVEEALRDDLIDYAADQVTTEQLNELDMSDNAIDIGFWGDLLEISASVPFEKC